MKKLLAILIACSAAVAVFAEPFVLRFSLDASSLTTNTVSTVRKEHQLHSWGVSYPSNAWGTVYLYKQDAAGNDILLDSVVTTNRGVYSFLARPVSFALNESYVVDATGVTGSGGTFNGSAED